MSTTVELCEQCDGEMEFHEDEWLCPYCDSVSGFAMVPSRDGDSFAL